MLVSFWERLEALARSSEVVIDRPKGSAHPRFPAIIYPLDYGYLKGTTGGDGNEIDVWRGSMPEEIFNAIVCTADLIKKTLKSKF